MMTPGEVGQLNIPTPNIAQAQITKGQRTPEGEPIMPGWNRIKPEDVGHDWTAEERLAIIGIMGQRYEHYRRNGRESEVDTGLLVSRMWQIAYSSVPMLEQFRDIILSEAAGTR